MNTPPAVTWFPPNQVLLRACFKVGTHKPEEFLERMALGAYMAGDWKDLKRVMVDWLQADPKKAKEWRQSLELAIPTDE